MHKVWSCTTSSPTDQLFMLITYVHNQLNQCLSDRTRSRARVLLRTFTSQGSCRRINRAKLRGSGDGSRSSCSLTMIPAAAAAANVVHLTQHAPATSSSSRDVRACRASGWRHGPSSQRLEDPERSQGQRPLEARDREDERCDEENVYRVVNLKMRAHLMIKKNTLNSEDFEALMRVKLTDIYIYTHICTYVCTQSGLELSKLGGVDSTERPRIQNFEWVSQYKLMCLVWEFKDTDSCAVNQ